MATFAALLRGINVGANKRIAMADLRELLAGLGFADVRTLLQSGNAVFTTRAARPERLAERIEKTIDDQFGLDVRCLGRSSDELRATIEGNPLGDVATDGSKLMALFLSAAPDPKLVKAHDPRSLAPMSPTGGPGDLSVVPEWRAGRAARQRVRREIPRRHGHRTQLEHGTKLAALMAG